jgi:hypothetical protein
VYQPTWWRHCVSDRPLSPHEALSLLYRPKSSQKNKIAQELKRDSALAKRRVGVQLHGPAGHSWLELLRIRQAHGHLEIYFSDNARAMICFRSLPGWRRQEWKPPSRQLQPQVMTCPFRHPVRATRSPGPLRAVSVAALPVAATGDTGLGAGLNLGPEMLPPHRVASKARYWRTPSAT